MPIFERSDADLLRDVHPVRRIMPFVMPTRTESAVLCREVVLATPAKEFLERFNAERPPQRPATLFHLLLRSLALVWHERPRLNRFVSGGQYYQRRGVWIAFSGKRGMSDDAPIFTAKRLFPPGETLTEMVDALWDMQLLGRSGKETDTDKEINLLVKLPAPLLRWFVRAGRWLNDHNLLPAKMIANDPLFASVFVANLGSVGIDACYHHNYDYGTIPIFVVMGKLKMEPIVAADGSVVAAEVFEMKYTYDERTEDGFYASRAISLLKHLLEHPEEL